MLKTSIILLSIALFSVTSCSTSVGNVPKDVNPDVVDVYNEGGYSLLEGGKTKSDKLSIPDFATKLCKDKGYSSWDGYKLGVSSSSGSSIGGFQLSSKKSRKIKIWCKK
jgi:hypothetical protein